MESKFEKMALYSKLCNLGNIVKLDWKVSHQETMDALKLYNAHWHPYNAVKTESNNRWGLSITSHDGSFIDSRDLNSFQILMNEDPNFYQESNFNTPTELLTNVPSLKSLYDQFAPNIGRCHFLKLNQGGFFPPHRDHHGEPDYFRLFAVLNNHTDGNYAFLLDDQRIKFEPEHVYFVNFQINHTCFSFTDDVIFLIFTVKLCQENVDKIINGLAFK